MCFAFCCAVSPIPELPNTNQMNDDKLSVLFSALDIDGDGSIDLEELKAFAAGGKPWHKQQKHISAAPNFHDPWAAPPPSKAIPTTAEEIEVIRHRVRHYG